MICETCKGTGLAQYPVISRPGSASVRCPACEGIGKWGDMQDGMLTHYLTQAKSSDANIERRIEKEPFDFRDHMKNPPAKR